MIRIITCTLIGVLSCCCAFPDFAIATDLSHGDKGFELRSSDGRYLMQLQARLQFRYAVPFDTDPLTFDDFDDTRQQVFKINRARLKIGGHAFESWLKYYWEYDLVGANLLDFRLTAARHPQASVKVGQWKAHYNRERIISSGKLQMVDRSLITRPFTIDRQQGVSLFGRLKGDGSVDFNYWVSVFTGTGRGARENDDDHLMYMARVQWNFLGRELAFSSSDISFHGEGAGVLALAAVTNRSQYTRFSTEGGGELEGYEPGDPGQYRVNQWMEESAFKYRGFSWQQEFHWKRIKDRKDGEITTLIGNYAEFGYFFHNLRDGVPEPLELAFRHAFYIPNVDETGNMQQEFSLATNWFFNGHLNKLTAEISYFVFEQSVENERDGFRFRLQWDISV